MRHAVSSEVMNEDISDTAPPAAGHAIFVQCKRSGGALIAKLLGPSIGQREAPIISKTVLAELEQEAEPPRAVVLDFRRITFINSMGLGMCIEVRNAMHQRGGKTILYCPSEQIMSVLKMTKMDRLYTIVDDEERLRKTLRS